MQIKLAETDVEVKNCYPVMRQLRPHLSEGDFVEAVARQQSGDGYHLAFLEDDGAVRAVAGFRLGEMLYRGRFLYVDDLVTDETARSRQYGDGLFDWLVRFARDNDCRQLDLDSGVQRFDAHRFYFRKRMHVSSYHFTLALD